MEERLKYIAKKESIAITPEAISEIAYYANGGLRDAIGMLDKLHSFTNEKITVDVFKSINGMISQEEIEKFYNFIFEKDIVNILDIVNRISEQGYDFKNFIERVMLLVRDKIVDHYINKSEIIGSIDYNVNLISVLNDILNRLKEAVNPMIIVQIYILKFIEDFDNEKKNEDEIISREIKIDIKDNVQKDVVDSKNNKKTEKNKIDININEKIKNIRINNAMATANMNYKKELNTIWKSINRYS